MAKLKNPLFSVSAQASIAGTLNYQMQKGKAVARRWHKPLSMASPNQATQREKYTAAVAAWVLMSPAEKQAYIPLAETNQITPFNAYLSIELKAQPPIKQTTWDLGATTWDLGATLWDVTI